MLNRRMFTGCAICAAIGLAADDALAEAPPGLKRTIIARSDGPVEGYETLETIVDVAPEFVIDWHTHPGTESGYTLEGGGELSIKGAAAQVTGPGVSWAIPAETPHQLRNGAQATRLLVTFTVRKGQPLSTPVPAPT